MRWNGKRSLELFLSTLRISACTFGGGYVIVPLLRKRFVEELGWIDEKEMLDLIAVSQSSPGPIAMNASLMIGYRVGGLPGALCTALGTVLPPLVIISVISLFYAQFRDNVYVSAIMKGMQAGVAAVVCNVVLDMSQTVLRGGNALSVALMLGVFVAVAFFQANIIAVILCCGLIGLLSGTFRNRRAKTGTEGGGEK